MCKIIGSMSIEEMVFAGLAVVRLIDQTNYEPGMCSNGGHYAHYKTFGNEGSAVVAHYSSTSEFQCCPLCGQYEGNSSHVEEGWCTPEIHTLESLAKEIENYLQDQTSCSFMDDKALIVQYKITGDDFWCTMHQI